MSLVAFKENIPSKLVTRVAYTHSSISEKCLACAHQRDVARFTPHLVVVITEFEFNRIIIRQRQYQIIAETTLNHT